MSYLAWKVLEPGLLKKQIPARHANHFYHHCTAAFGGEQIEHFEQNVWMNKPNELTFSSIMLFEDDKGQAINIFHPMYSGFSLNQFPHITISCKEGVRPFYSNALVATKKNFVQAIRIKIPMKLELFK